MLDFECWILNFNHVITLNRVDRIVSSYSMGGIELDGTHSLGGTVQ